MSYALSLKQPWAEFILQGKKTIETRLWNTHFRGDFYIPASKTIDLEACKEYGIDPDSLVTGAIVGKATILDVKVYSSPERFLEDDKKHMAGFHGYSRPVYGFILDNVKRVNPIPQKGFMNFFEVTY